MTNNFCKKKNPPKNCSSTSIASYFTGSPFQSSISSLSATIQNTFFGIYTFNTVTIYFVVTVFLFSF